MTRRAPSANPAKAGLLQHFLGIRSALRVALLQLSGHARKLRRDQDRLANPFLFRNLYRLSVDTFELADSSKHHLLIKPRHTAKIAEKGFKITTIRM